MARGSTSAANGSAKSLPPSHPAEQYEEHRAFLIRSLERNDLDMAALLELTRSLHSVKRAIVESCGEATLLDLGQGKIQLAPNNDDSLVGDSECLPDDQGQDLCVDFLLRMKLRRKLLNRVFRRLNRVAHAMDGNDVNPTAPPRYGELGIFIEPTEVEKFQQQWARQEEARLMIEQEREMMLEQRMKGSAAQAQDVADSENSDAEPATDKDNKAKTTVDEPDAPPSSSEPTTSEIDYEAVRSFKDGYEKMVDPETGAFKYTILEQPHEEDYVKIKFGAGIGATQRNMSVKEKESEFKRWQTSLLGRIPEQPTFKDLGLEHRVFRLEERKKLALEASKEVESNQKKRFADDADELHEKGKGGKTLRRILEDKDTKEQQDEPENEDGMDLDEKEDASSDADLDTTDPEEYHVKSSGTNSGNEDEEALSQVEPTKNKVDDDDSVQEDETEQILKRINPISLAPVPSFYDQDLKRIRLIHGDMVSASIQFHNRERLEEVIREYNKELRSTQEIFHRRQQTESKLQNVAFDVKRHLQDINNYSSKLAMARADWFKKQQVFNNEKLNQTLKSRWNHTAQGTPMTQWYGNRPEPVHQEIAGCMADIIDAVELIEEGKLGNPKFMEPFVAPPDTSKANEVVDPATGETLIQRTQRVQQHYKKEADALAQKQRQTEDDRARAWRRMLKVKAETGIPQQVITNQRRVLIQVTEQNYHTLQMPYLTLSMTESVPRDYGMVRAALPSYIPTPSVAMPLSSSNNESKYAIARVRARIGADGSVAPVSEPKKGVDGLYLRPAGRTRKGMDWDAYNGKWVPAPNS